MTFISYPYHHETRKIRIDLLILKHAINKADLAEFVIISLIKEALLSSVNTSILLDSLQSMKGIRSFWLLTLLVVSAITIANP